MPNYNLVINSKFRPFSYQEMLAPVQASTEAHKTIEEEYGNLSTQADVWKTLANEQRDPDAYQQYMTYANDLQAQADELAMNGLNPTSRQSMLNMRKRYASEILPIENAFKRREEHIKEQRAKGNRTLNEFDASKTSLDKYLHNPSLSYNTINLDDVYKQSVQVFSQYQNNFRNPDKFDVKDVDKYHKALIKQHGFSADTANAIASAIMNKDYSTAESLLFKGVAEGIYNSTGVGSWNDAQAENAVLNEIARGVYTGMGKEDLQLFNNEQQLFNDKLRIARASGSKESPSMPFHPISRLQQSRTAAMNDLKKSNNYYDSKTGKFKLNPSISKDITLYLETLDAMGIDEFNKLYSRGEELHKQSVKTSSDPSEISGAGMGISAGIRGLSSTTTSQSFKNKLSDEDKRAYDLYNSTNKGRYYYDYISSKFKGTEPFTLDKDGKVVFNDAVVSNYATEYNRDKTLFTDYSYTIDETDRQAALNQWADDYKNQKKITVQEYDAKTGKFIDKESVKASELKDPNKYSLSRIEFGEAGNIYVFTSVNDNKEYYVPIKYNELVKNLDINRDIAAAKLRALQEAAETGNEKLYNQLYQDLYNIRTTQYNSIAKTLKQDKSEPVKM